MTARRLLLVLVIAVVAWGIGRRPWEKPGARGRPRTIVLFTIDTLRRDRVGAYAPGGADASAMPRLTAFAERALVFTDARTPVPLTLPSHTTMLTGLPPAVTGVRLNTHGRIPPPDRRGYPLLAESLKAAGWRTGAFLSASPLKHDYGLDQGFDRYDDEGLEDETGYTYTARPGAQTVDRALAWLGRQDRTAPVFLWVHAFEPHAPYAPGPGTAEERYDRDCAQADAVAGRLLDGLSAAGRDDAAVLVVADHGEALDDLGERTHGLLLSDAVLRVPMILGGGGLEPGRRDDPADVADVAPTLADLAGLDTWPSSGGPGAGHDLLRGPAPADRVRVAESLYARHLHGWAQLVAVVTPRGDTLVDAGLDRLLWLEPAPFGQPQRAPEAPSGRKGLARLGEVLRAYRQGERSERITPGNAAAGYGHGGRVEPFLSPAENARLPNPYEVITRHFALDYEKEKLRQGAPPTAVARRLETLAAEDPGDPAVRFWLGRAWQRWAEVAPGEEDAATARRLAAQAYLEALEQGRRDATTLVLAAGVTAEDDAARGLDLLDRFASTVPPDCQVLVLRAKLLHALGRDDEADAACRAAEARCRTAHERALLEQTRAGETCR